MFSCFSTKSESPAQNRLRQLSEIEKMEKELCAEYRSNLKAVLNPINVPVHPKYTERIKPHHSLKIFPQLVEDDNDIKFSCPICFEDKSVNDIDYIPCFHKFCKSCLTSIKKENCPKCPICRLRLKN